MDHEYYDDDNHDDDDHDDYDDGSLCGFINGTRLVAAGPYKLRPTDKPDGMAPLNKCDCPLGGDLCCVSRSGNSYCGGWIGEVSVDGIDYVVCQNKPRS